MVQQLAYYIFIFSTIIPSVFGWLTASDGYNIGVTLGSAAAGLIFLIVMGFLIWHCCLKQVMQDYRRDHETYEEKKGGTGLKYKKRPQTQNGKTYTIREDYPGAPSKLSNESLQQSGGYYSGEGGDDQRGSGGGSPVDYGTTVDKYGGPPAGKYGGTTVDKYSGPPAGKYGGTTVDKYGGPPVDKYGTTVEKYGRGYDRGDRPGYGVGNRAYVTDRRDIGDRYGAPRDMDSSTESRTSVRVAQPRDDLGIGSRAVVPYDTGRETPTKRRYEGVSGYKPYSSGGSGAGSPRGASESPRGISSRSPARSPAASRAVVIDPSAGTRVVTTTETYGAGGAPLIETTEQRRTAPGGASVTYKTTRTIQQRTVQQQKDVPAAYMGSSV